MKKHYVSALAALTITTSAFAGNPEDYTGSIWPTAAQFCPAGTVEANGQLLPLSQNQALFALFRTTYGGDGKNTFGVPDMRDRMPVGTGTIPGTTTVVKNGTYVGMVNTKVALPAHTHVATFTRGPMKVNIPVSTTPGTMYSPSQTSVNYLAGATGAAGAQMWSDSNGSNPLSLAGVSSSGGTQGGSVSVDVAGGTPSTVTTIPPQLGVRFCIVTDGTWPNNPNN
jgi:microcystin-dependent protein